MTEQIYIIPLRKEFLKVPKYKRAKKATTALRQYLRKHVKKEKILLSKALNEYIWKHGIKNPPAKVKVSVETIDTATAKAKLFGEQPEKNKESKKQKINEGKTVADQKNQQEQEKTIQEQTPNENKIPLQEKGKRTKKNNQEEKNVPKEPATKEQ